MGKQKGEDIDGKAPENLPGGYCNYDQTGIVSGEINTEDNNEKPDINLKRLLEDVSVESISVLNKNNDDESAGFTADEGSFYELERIDLEEVEVKPAENPLQKPLQRPSPRIAAPTLELQALNIHADPDKIEELVDAVYAKDGRRDGLYILPKKKKFLYGGKEYATDYLNGILDGKGLADEHKDTQLKNDLYSIAQLLHDIPYIALRPVQLIQEEGSYTIEFTRLRKGGESSGFKSFEHKFDHSLNKFELIEVREVLPQNDELAAEIESDIKKNKAGLIEKMKDFAIYTLQEEYSDKFAEIHSEIQFDFDMELDLKSPLIHVEGIDHEREKLFELKLNYQGVNSRVFANEVGKFKNILGMPFGHYRLK